MCSICEIDYNTQFSFFTICNRCKEEVLNCDWCNGTGIIRNKHGFGSAPCARCFPIREMLNKGD